MAAFSNTATWSDTTATCGPTISITVNFSDTTYSSNLPDSYFEPKPDEEGLLQALKAQRRQWSIEALLDMKYQHDRVRPATRSDVDPCYARRPHALRRSAKAIKNWRPRR